ncbi:unnamed protein product [Prunus armeniaca]
MHTSIAWFHGRRREKLIDENRGNLGDVAAVEGLGFEGVVSGRARCRLRRQDVGVMAVGQSGERGRRGEEIDQTRVCRVFQKIYRPLHDE